MNRVTFGALLIFIGLILVANVFVAETIGLFRFWPLLIVIYAAFTPTRLSTIYRGGLVVVGLILLADALFPSMLGPAGSWFWGALLFVGGLIMILSVAEQEHKPHGFVVKDWGSRDAGELRESAREFARSTADSVADAVREGVSEIKFAVREGFPAADAKSTEFREEDLNMEEQKERQADYAAAGIKAEYSGDTAHYYTEMPEGATVINCTVELSAGSIELIGGTDKLFEIDTQQDSVVEPEVSLKVNDASGGKAVNLHIDQHFFKGSHPFNLSTVWKLKLNREILMNLNAEVNAARAKLDLSELRVQSITLENNAASTDLKVGAREERISLHIENNAAKLEVYLPGGYAYSANIDSNVARHNAASIMPKRTDGVWMTEDAETNPRKITMNVENNAASLDFKVY